MRFTIDRIIDKYAVVELDNMEMIEIPMEILPSDAKEGDIIHLTIDYHETSLRKQRIEDKFNSLLSEEDK